MTRARAAWKLEVAKWDYTIAVNLRGVFLVTRAVLPLGVTILHVTPKAAGSIDLDSPGRRIIIAQRLLGAWHRSRRDHRHLEEPSPVVTRFDCDIPPLLCRNERL